MDAINAEIFTLTYGSMVRQLIADLEDVNEVNKQLDTMGYNIGIRLIDEFLAKSKTGKCIDFRDTADKIAKVGFKMFLNTSAAVANWNADSTECSLILEDNPLTDFVELPENYAGLSYCNVLCGVIRGALEMVNINVSCNFVKDVLRGDDVSELRLKLLSQMHETYPYKDDD
ncbi:Trafficking protein particle complex subunit 3 [Coccomyxa sp. Obi]|nr:Trafficking protein particle complex subunit 3 [Coccomyxa sp. Obi]